MAHKKHKRKYLNILLIPDDESSPRSLKVRYTLLSVAAVALSVIFVAFLVGVFTYGQLVQKAFENRSLRQENGQLKQQLQKVNKLAAELNQLKTFGEKVRNSLTGYVKVNDKIKAETNRKNAVILQNKPLISVFNSIPVKPPVIGFISQQFKEDVHNGIDIAAPEGTPIVAPANGRVLFSGWTLNGGNTIIVGHDFGYYTFYKHNLRNLVQVNQQVNKGDVIAYLGNSGEKSYGPHLHFEIWNNGRPVDPRILIPEYGNEGF